MIYLQRELNQAVGWEEKLIYQYCIINRIPVTYFQADELPDLPLMDVTLMVGSVEACLKYFEIKDIPAPAPNYYPTQLQQYLYRKVIERPLSDVLTSLFPDPVFIKSSKWKQLTGQILSDNLHNQIHHMVGEDKVWLSDVVTWLAEYRVYVNNGEILAVSLYSKMQHIVALDITLDMNVIRQAVEQFTDSPVSYAFDWGVLSTGETALVEMNDGWAIGAYDGITATQYFNFLKARWDQITNI